MNNFYIGMINLFLAGLWVFLPVKTSLANEAITCSELAHFDYDMTKGFYYSSDIDAERAIEVCSREHAATPDDAELNFLLGRAYRGNDDSEESLVFFKKAYELGHADAAANIADSYFYGAGGHSYSTKDYFEWSKKAHDAGSLAGTFNLAHAYRDGLGVISNWSESSRLLAIASSGGLTEATLEIAENHAYGSFGQEQSQEKARDIWRRLKIDGVEKAWLNEAVFKLNQPRDVGDVLEALAELKRLAERGWYLAASELAFINMRPENYEYSENNQVKALISVDNGLNYALDVIDTNYFLTNFHDYFFDSQTAKNMSAEQAEKLMQALEKVAKGDEKQGAILASQILGQLEYYGTIRTPSLQKALDWFHFAVDEHDDHFSASWLSFIYREEAEVLNPSLAIKYAKIAALNPDPYYQAEAYVTLGVFFMYNQEQQDFPKADQYFRMADEIIRGSEFSMGSFYEHLTLLHLLGGNGLKRDLDVARNFAEQIEPNGGSDFPLYFLTRHKFSNQTTVEEIIKMLERSFLEGKGAASFALAAIAEVRGDIVNQYKWTTICSMICSDSIKEDYLHYAGVLSKKMAPFQKSEGQNAVGKTLAKYFAQSEEKDQDYLSAGSAKFARMGNFYALLIGNADYEQLNDLETPIRDIRAVGSLLEEKYGAVSYYVENGSRREIMSAFKDLATRVAGNDSVLIFYAGHGKMIEAQNEGYWLPVDAEPSDDFYWISNSYIKSKVREMGAKNILLIADSCFSGLLTRGLEMAVEDSTPSRIKEFQNTPSRVVISSGGLEPVLDGFGGENSIFANEFIKLLKEKNEPLTSGELYTVIRDKVVEKSIEIGAKQVPFMATLVAEGHEGPDFVFVPN